jgi:hypothetical protein
MPTDPHDDVQRAVADHLEVGPDDLELIERTDTTYAFRQLSSGTTRTAHVELGPEGPVVTVEPT